MWTSNKMNALYILLALLGVGVGAWFLLRHTLRSRLRVKKLLQADPDMSNWPIVFGWSPKVLYVPTMLASLLPGFRPMATSYQSGMPSSSLSPLKYLYSSAAKLTLSRCVGVVVTPSVRAA